MVQLDRDQTAASIADLLAALVAVEGEPDVSPWSDTQKVEADNPPGAPGELASPRRIRHDVREHLEHGHLGLRGDLPLGANLPVRSAATLVVRAFAAYAKGDRETCDRLMARGCEVWGEAFTGFVAYAVSPAFPYRPADPAWDAFRARLAVTVLPPGSQGPARRPGRHRRSGAHCAHRGTHRPR